MAYYADRVKDTTTTTGTGAITLAESAPTGYQTFATALGSGTSQLGINYVIELNSGINGKGKEPVPMRRFWTRITLRAI